MLNTNDKLIDRVPRPPNRIVATMQAIEQDPTCPTQFIHALNANVLVPTKRLSAITAKHKKAAVRHHTIAKRWGISLPMAQRTVEATTQRIIRTLAGPNMNRRFRTNDRQLRYRRLAHNLFTDTLIAKTRTWYRKNKYAQVFTTDFGWCRAYPMQNKSDAHIGFSTLAQTVGVPPTVIMDGSKEQTLGTFRQKVRQCGTRLKQTEPYLPWQNAAESAIRELKRASARQMMQTSSPTKLWDHSLELQALIRSHSALDHPILQGQVPETLVTGQTADISTLAEFQWYDWVRFYSPNSSYPESKEVYGRWLGPAIDIGPAMTAKILQSNGQVIYTSSYRHLNDHEHTSPDEIGKRTLFDKLIKTKLGGPLTESKIKEIDPRAVTPTYDPTDPDYTIPDIDDATPEYQDTYIGAEVTLPLQGTMKQGKVKQRSRTESGDLFGKANENPILDTRSYDIEFPDGTLKSYTANIIAENMIAQCDPLGNQFRLMEAITGHKTDGTEVHPDDTHVQGKSNRHTRKTTKGWHLCILWKDGSTTWERLADIKESYPVEVAEYAIAQEISDHPAFAWWVPYVLRKRDRIISAVNKRYHKRTHKFGFEIPKTVKRALELDKENGNTLWQDAIDKEMQNVRIAFKVVEDESEIPSNSQYMECHMVFDVKLESNFRRKARLVAGGHTVDCPNVPTYASVVSRETVRIALTLAALNDLEVKTSDIQNAYLSAPCEETIHTRLGPEFGPDEGKLAIITRALYGLKSAGSSFNWHLADCMRSLGYTPCKADPDLWMKKTIRPDDNLEYYSYVLLFVDDCLAIHHDAEACLREIDKFFPMKEGSIGDPDIYLGAKLRPVKLSNGVTAWGFSPSKYVQEAVHNVEEYIKQNMDRKLPARHSGPWPTGYTPEDDESDELDPKTANYYQSVCGVLHWILELGRVDIITEVSKLASQMAAPRVGHLDAALTTINYLKKKHNSRMVFDPTYPEIDQDGFKRYNWTRFYGDVKEAIPIDAPEPLGKEVDLRMFVDADHAGDKSNRRSRTGFFIFLNSAPITWLSRRQATVETSVFGAEFVAMKQGIETLRGLRYKLRMMGVPLSGPSYVYGDNMSVIKNSSKPESTLNKKSNQICYHAVREAVAMNECLISHIPTSDNIADLATKLIPNGIQRARLVDKLLCDIESNSKSN